MVRRSGFYLLALAALLSIATINSQAQSFLTHHVRGVTLNGQAQSTGRLPATQIMQLDVVLPLSDQAGLDAFLNDLYDPASPSYRQFLTRTEFTEGLAPPRNTMTPWFVSYRRTDSQWLADRAMAWMCRSRDPFRPSKRPSM